MGTASAVPLLAQPHHLKSPEAQPRAVRVWNSCPSTAGAKWLCLEVHGASQQPLPPATCYLGSSFTAPSKPLQNDFFPSQSLLRPTLHSSPHRPSPQPTLCIRSAGGQGDFSSSVLHGPGDSAYVGGGGCHCRAPLPSARPTFSDWNWTDKHCP